MKLRENLLTMELKPYKERYFDYRSYNAQSYISIGEGKISNEDPSIILLQAIFQNG